MCKGQRGFTLLETLVSLALTGVILVATVGLGMSMTWTYYGGVALQQLQREVVLSVEQIYNHVKVAHNVVDESAGSAIVYKVYGLAYDGSYTVPPPVEIRLDTAAKELFVDSRKVSGNIAGLSIVDGSELNEKIVTVTSIDRFALAPTGRLPVFLSTQVYMRNYLQVHPQITSGPNTPVISFNNCTIEWMTNMDTSGWIYYGTDPTALTGEHTYVGVTSTHSETITGLSPGTAYYYRIRGRSVSGQEFLSPVHSFTTTSL